MNKNVIINWTCRNHKHEPSSVGVYENEDGTLILWSLESEIELEANENPENAVQEAIEEIIGFTDYQNLAKVQWGLLNPNDLSKKANDHEYVFVMIDTPKVVDYVRDEWDRAIVFKKEMAEKWIRLNKSDEKDGYTVPIEGNQSSIKILTEDDLINYID